LYRHSIQKNYLERTEPIPSHVGYQINYKRPATYKWYTLKYFLYIKTLYMGTKDSIAIIPSIHMLHYNWHLSISYCLIYIKLRFLRPKIILINKKWWIRQFLS
jgi:hypothetical protein